MCTGWDFAKSFLPLWSRPSLFLGIPHPVGSSILGSPLGRSEMGELRYNRNKCQVLHLGSKNVMHAYQMGDSVLGSSICGFWYTAT